MRQYLDLVQKILSDGCDVQTGAYLPGQKRKPTARSLFAQQLRFDLRDGFPAVTTKPLFWRGVAAELLWFLRGETNIRWLRDVQNVHIWDEWADENGDIGPGYGRQFRACQGVRWMDRPSSAPAVSAELVEREGKFLHGCLIDGKPHGVCLFALAGYQWVWSDAGWVMPAGPYHETVEIDQIGCARDDIRRVIKDPGDRSRRRIIVDLWNPAQVSAMKLPPCHTLHMYYVSPPPTDSQDLHVLSLHLMCRSIDVIKGLPFNIASYALMLHLMAHVTGTDPGELVVTINDAHIYDNQFLEAEEQLQRHPRLRPRFNMSEQAQHILKDLTIGEVQYLTSSMFRLSGYESWGPLKNSSEIAV